jgi:hypothetical protein
VEGELKVETESAPTCDWWNESRVEAIERSCANPINRTCDREFQNPCRNYRAILKAHFMSITIYPTYRFADAPAMLDWLERAFGSAAVPSRRRSATRISVASRVCARVLARLSRHFRAIHDIAPSSPVCATLSPARLARPFDEANHMARLWGGPRPDAARCDQGKGYQLPTVQSLDHELTKAARD